MIYENFLNARFVIGMLRLHLVHRREDMVADTSEQKADAEGDVQD